MEFKYRAVDKKPTTSTTSFRHSTVNYDVSDNSLPGASSFSCLPMNTYRMPVMGDVFLRELEKEQIRREIIAGEIARRRELEAEVRRELALERSLGGIQMLRYLTAPLHSLHQRVNHTAVDDVDNIIGVTQPRLLPIESPVEIKPPPQSDRDKVMVLAAPPRSFQQRVNSVAVADMNNIIGASQPRLKPIECPVEIKPSPQTDKDKVIVLARPKPDHDLHSAKRKAVAPVVCDSEPSALDSSKKAKKERSCALCQVNVTSEASLNKHLAGKKHKAKEATVTTQTIGLDAKPNRQSPQTGLILEELSQTVVDEGLIESKNEEKVQLVEKSYGIGGLENPNGSDTEEALKTNASARKKVTLWCEVCQVPTSSQAVMEIHKKGKKHQKQMMKLNQN